MSVSDDVTDALDCNPAADAAAIDSFAATFGFDPPEGYTRFLRRSNGGEGFVGKRYLILWPLEELHQHNEGYRVERFAPRLFLFGTDGGNEAYAFDLRQQKPTIVSVPFIGMSLEEVRQCGATFDDFLEGLSK